MLLWLGIISIKLFPADGLFMPSSTWTFYYLDMMQLILFVWRFIKSKIYQMKIPNTKNLKQWILATAVETTTALLKKFFCSVMKHWRLCLGMQGCHNEIYGDYVLVWHSFQHYCILCNKICLITKCLVTLELSCCK